MVETELNGARPAAAELPEVVHFSGADARRVPAPGTQRALKADTGRSYDELCGPGAESADRFQTMIWVKLRRDRPGLRWEDCADIDVQIDDEAALDVDPTRLVASATSPPSAASGG